MQPFWTLLTPFPNHYKKYEGKTFQLAGPAEYTYKEVVEFVQDVTTLKKNMIDVPVSAAAFAGKLYQETINPFLTEDMIIQLT